jgi:hypothetical protein
VRTGQPKILVPRNCSACLVTVELRLSLSLPRGHLQSGLPPRLETHTPDMAGISKTLKRQISWTRDGFGRVSQYDLKRLELAETDLPTCSGQTKSSPRLSCSLFSIQCITNHCACDYASTSQGAEKNHGPVCADETARIGHCHSICSLNLERFSLVLY